MKPWLRYSAATLIVVLLFLLSFRWQSQKQQPSTVEAKPTALETGGSISTSFGQAKQGASHLTPVQPIVADPPVSPARPGRAFAEDKLLDSRLDELGQGEFRRIELVETTLKYPFIRIETHFRREGTNEVILGHHEMVADHVSVELRPGSTEADLATIIEPLGGTFRKKLNLEYAETYLIGLPEPTLDAAPDAIAFLSGFKDVVAEVDGDVISHKTTIPNDPHFSSLWHFHNTGQQSGLRDADIDATEAWIIHTGSPNVIVAISDTGVDYTHPDLRGNIWVNPGELPNNHDSDRNTYRDDLIGWNFVDGTTNVMDLDGHGTMVSGIIGARGNNGIGGSGVAWHCKLMPLKVLDSKGGYASDIAEGFDYARRMGAKIVNASHGGPGSSVMRRAVDSLEAAGVLLVGAAGNYGNNTDSKPLYPASYPNANVISVAASGRGDLLASYSSYGAGSVHLVAPGNHILSTTLDHGYAVESGTSFAAPMVAGVAALVLAQNPGWNGSQIRSRILSNVDRIPSLAGMCTTGGRLNAYKALLPQTTLAEALDGDGFSWSTDGHAPWIGGKIFSRDKVDSAETGKVWHNEESRLQAIRSGPGRFSFWWKVSSEAEFDFLVFYLNGVERARISGQTAWAQQIFDLSSGNNTLVWKYVKDGSFSDGLDKGFVDEVYFLGLPPVITAQPSAISAYTGTNVVFSVGATGTAPFTYQWRKDGSNIPGATRSTLTFLNVQQERAGNYSVVIKNKAGSVTSATAKLSLCTVTLSPPGPVFGPEGGQGSFSIGLSGGCGWEVTRTNDWVTFNSSASGNSSATFHFTVEANESTRARAAFLSVGNRKYVVRQNGTPAPGSLNSQRFTMTVTNSSGTLPANDSFLLETGFAGNPEAYRRVPLTEVSGADQGLFAYAKTGGNSASLTLFGAVTNTVNLTFESRTSGNFLWQDPSGGIQEGVFNAQPQRLDFNNDGFQDILWQSNDGVLAAWCMRGTEFLRAVPLRNQQPLPLAWRVVGATDLLGRNEVDIILQHNNGQLAVWQMSEGTNFVQASFLRDGTPLAAGWKVMGTGDFNQDGQPDLLLQHQDTRSAVWFMNGTDFIRAEFLRNGVAAGAGWRIAGVGDFDGDGENDVLWQHFDGRLNVWHFIGADFVALTPLRSATPDWRVVGISDFNNDGKNDLLLQHTDRRLAVWFFNDTEFLRGMYLRGGLPAGAAWRVVAPK